MASMKFSHARKVEEYVSRHPFLVELANHQFERGAIGLKLC